MFLNRREEFSYVRSVGDEFDQAVELLTALLAVDATIRMDFKNTVYQLAQMIVHSLTHLAFYDLDE